MKASAGIRALSGVALVLSIAWGADAHASGFQLFEQSASGLGVAFAGMPAASLDASTVFWNPAAMSFMPGSEIALSADYIKPSFTFSSAAPPSGSTYAVFGNGGDAGVSSWIPAIYARFSLPQGFAAGIAVNAPFGLSTHWQGEWAGMFRAIESRIATLNINPTLSYSPSEFVSFGVGVSYQRLQATLSNALTPLIPTAQGRLDGSDWAWGWNAGVLFDFRQGTRLGVTYRAAIDYTVNGMLVFNNPAFAALDSSARAELRLPQVASVGLSHQFTPSLRALLDYTWTGWNSVRTLAVQATSGPEAGNDVELDTLNFNNSWRVGAGIEYQTPMPGLLLRGGIAYDRSPVQDAYRTPNLPDNNRHWLAAGVRYAHGDSWSVDAGYAYLWIQDAPSELGTLGPVPGTLIGTYHSHASILGAQAALRF